MIERRRLVPPYRKFDIACYWQERQHRETKSTKRFFVMDIGEPSCFACGWYSEKWDLLPNDTDSHLRRIWRETRGLEICHLVPYALGGADEVYNLVVLCGPCHMAAPDFSIAEYMLQWMQGRSSWRDREQSEAMRATEESFRAFGLRWPPASQDTEEMEAVLRSQQFQDFFMESIVVAPKNGPGDRVSTLVAAYCQYRFATFPPTLF